MGGSSSWQVVVEFDTFCLTKCAEFAQKCTAAQIIESSKVALVDEQPEQVFARLGSSVAALTLTLECVMCFCAAVVLCRQPDGLGVWCHFTRIRCVHIFKAAALVACE